MRDLKTEGMMQMMKGKIRSMWGNVTDDDVEQSKGDMDTLIGKIKARTGESTESIREKLERMKDM